MVIFEVAVNRFRFTGFEAKVASRITSVVKSTQVWPTSGQSMDDASFRGILYEDLVKLNFDPSGVSFVEGVSFATSSTSDFVKKSWDFEEISRRYTELIDFHNSTISFKLDNEYTEWLQKENFLWREAFKMDPFLPDELLPSNYKGKKALAARKRNYTALFER